MCQWVWQSGGKADATGKLTRASRGVVDGSRCEAAVHRNGRPEVFEVVDRVGDHGVEGTQAEERKRVGGESDERVGRDAEDRRNRVDGKEHVGELDTDERKEQRRGKRALGTRKCGKKVVAVVRVRRRQIPARNTRSHLDEH